MNFLPFLYGVAAGSLLAGLQRHPLRALGFVPFALTGLFIALLAASLFPALGVGLDIAFGCVSGLLGVSLATYSSKALPLSCRGIKGLLLGVVVYVGILGLFALMTSGVRSENSRIGSAGRWVLVGCAGVVAAAAWWVFFRETVEHVLEGALWPLYRIRARGPGLAACPRRGPVVILANHTSYLDPLWLAKVFPRRIIAMMTSVFYDLPIMHWLMTRVAHAIRVESSTFRREAPELRQAIAALDQGECVVIFPEGMLRRREEVVLRPFGQGVWHILRERPTTPVIVCWIEGGWGSWASYYNGPPLKSKPLDWWRPIRIGASPPQVLDADILADHRRTRDYLRRACLNARAYLGLEPLAADKEETAVAEEESSEV